MILIGFLAIAGFFWITERSAHVFGALPYLLLLACPLMHLFTHHRHGEHQHNRNPKATGGRDGARGHAYARYTATTPRWIPRFTSNRSVGARK
jgi:hypothetical protein